MNEPSPPPRPATVARLETILVAVDLTPPSLAAAEWAAHVLDPDARLLLVHVLELQEFERFVKESENEVPAERLRAHAASAMNELSERVGADRAEVLVVEGAPADRLVEIATDRRVDLTVIGAHRGDLVGTLLGSVESRLLAASPCPVLVAHELPAGRPERIVAAVDEAGPTLEVLEWTRALAERFQSTGRIVFVVEPPAIPVATTLFATEDEYNAARSRVMAGAEAWVQAVSAESGVVRSGFEIGAAYGNPEEEIVAAADEVGAQLIIVGTRGRAHATALVLGSVSRRVIETARCPVLVVPPSTES